MSQIEGQRLLDLLERANGIAFLDTESTNLNGDFGSLLIGSVRSWKGPIKTFIVEQPGNDKDLVLNLKNELEKFDCWCSYFGKGHDIPFIQSRLLLNGLPALEKRLHLDLYFSIKSRIRTAKKGQAHLLDWLQLPERKMSMGANEWNLCITHDKVALNKMAKRCESDVMGLICLYKRVKHLIIDVNK